MLLLSLKETDESRLDMLLTHVMAVNGNIDASEGVQASHFMQEVKRCLCTTILLMHLGKGQHTC